jgi:hypothetical protein
MEDKGQLEGQSVELLKDELFDGQEEHAIFFNLYLPVSFFSDELGGQFVGGSTLCLSRIAADQLIDEKFRGSVYPRPGNFDKCYCALPPQSWI